MRFRSRRDGHARAVWLPPPRTSRCRRRRRGSPRRQCRPRVARCRCPCRWRGRAASRHVVHGRPVARSEPLGLRPAQPHLATGHGGAGAVDGQCRDVRPTAAGSHRGAHQCPCLRVGARLDDGRQSRVIGRYRLGLQLVPGRGEFGKDTTRAPAARTAAACTAAFVAMSWGTHSGWATAMTSGRRVRTLTELGHHGLPRLRGQPRLPACSAPHTPQDLRTNVPPCVRKPAGVCGAAGPAGKRWRSWGDRR
jgi:hypothetical protein